MSRPFGRWHARAFLASLLFFTLLLAAAMVLALIASDSIVQNTDSSAPISQLRLLEAGRVVNLHELRLARIPSFFPDLLAIWMLIRLGGWADTTVILMANHALVMACLFLGLQAWLLAIGAGLSRWSSLLVSLSGTFLCFWLSPLYRQMVGIVLTPLHHGGNLISTMLAIALFALAFQRRATEWGKVAWLVLLALVAVASASNVLFLFTACLPLVVGSAWIVPRSALDGRTRMFMLASLPLAAAAGLLAVRLFNLQCVSPIQTLAFSNLLAAYSHSRAFLLASAAAVALLVTVKAADGAAARGAGRGGLPFGPGRIISLLIALSALSPFLYTILLPDLAPRYLLILIMMSVVSLGLLARAAGWLPLGLSRASGHPSPGPDEGRGRRFLKEQIHAILLLALAGSYLVGPYASLMAREYLTAYEARFPLDRQAAELLPRLHHFTGLSDFWGANLAVLSEGRLDVQPIHSNGEPDLWAHNRETFLAPPAGSDGRGPSPAGVSMPPAADKLAVKKYTFIYLREEEGNGLSQAEILRAYGEPTRRIGCREEGKDLCIFLYDDSRRIQQVIGGKLARFRNLCVPFRNDR